MKSQPITFQWHEHQQGLFGPGVSRPAEPKRAKPFTLVVRQQAAKPVKVTLMAESLKLAKRYAQARWPGSDVEVAA